MVCVSYDSTYGVGTSNVALQEASGDKQGTSENLQFFKKNDSAATIAVLKPGPGYHYSSNTAAILASLRYVLRFTQSFIFDVLKQFYDLRQQWQSFNWDQLANV